MVAMSGVSMKSPYPFSHEVSAYPSTVFMSVSTASRYAQASVPCAATSSRKNRAWKRLPCSRPCMSVMATTTVSISCMRTASRSASIFTML